MAEPVSKMTPHESVEQHDRRLVWERARIAEADDDIAAGRVISGDEALRWLEEELVWAETTPR